MKYTRLSALALGLLTATSLQANVLTTLKPIGFIANAITEGVTQTEVLLPVTASPHDYSLKPADLMKIKSAQLVVWVGDEMEGFLGSVVNKLPKSQVLRLESVPQIQTLVAKAKRTHGHEADHAEDAHGHEHAHGHSHDEDWHIWLSPLGAEIIANQIANRLITQMPEQRAKISQNLAQFKTSLRAKDAAIKAQLAPVKNKGFYTFHDAYNHFSDAYGLHVLGAFTINPSVAPGVKTLTKIKTHIQEHQAKCLFAEPQFTPKVVQNLAKNTGVGVGQLDPLGAKIALSKQAYPAFLQAIANDLHGCLSKAK